MALNRIFEDDSTRRDRVRTALHVLFEVAVPSDGIEAGTWTAAQIIARGETIDRMVDAAERLLLGEAIEPEEACRRVLIDLANVQPAGNA